MKNLAIVKACMFLAILAFAITSCKKIQNPEPIVIIDASKTGKLKGIAYAPMNDTTSADTYAPSGTILLVEMDTDNYPGAVRTGDGQKMLYTATVGTNGAYEIDIPAPSVPMQVTVRPQDFRANYVDGAGRNESAEFYRGAFSTTVIYGGTTIEDFWYNRN